MRKNGFFEDLIWIPKGSWKVTSRLSKKSPYGDCISFAGKKVPHLLVSPQTRNFSPLFGAKTHAIVVVPEKNDPIWWPKGSWKVTFRFFENPHMGDPHIGNFWISKWGTFLPPNEGCSKSERKILVWPTSIAINVVFPYGRFFKKSFFFWPSLIKQKIIFFDFFSEKNPHMGTGPHMGTSHFFSVVTFKMRHTKKGKKK